MYYGYKYIFHSNSRGSRYARAFGPTDLLTSLREEKMLFKFKVAAGSIPTPVNIGLRKIEI